MAKSAATPRSRPRAGSRRTARSRSPASSRAPPPPPAAVWVTPGEQLKRFKARQDTPYKRFKITEEDWRNRKQWPKYARAVEDMLERTNTEPAPWEVVASDDKLFSRIETLEKLCGRIEAAL